MPSVRFTRFKKSGGTVDYAAWHQRRVTIARNRAHSEDALVKIRAALEEGVRDWDDPVNNGSNPIVVATLASPAIGFVVSSAASSNEVRLVLFPNAPYVSVLPPVKGAGENGRVIQQILSASNDTVNINTPETGEVGLRMATIIDAIVSAILT